MLSKATAQLVEEILAYFGEEHKKRAKAEPEACLISMLLVIKKELPHVYATLGMTIEQAVYDSHLKVARQELEKVS